MPRFCPAALLALAVAVVPLSAHADRAAAQKLMDQAAEAMKALSSGQVLKILATDPGSKADFPAWAEATRNRVLKHDATDGVFIYWIQKS